MCLFCCLKVVLLLKEYCLDSFGILLAGVLLFSHINLDRMLGYGLKYPDNFKNTHLNNI